MDTHISKIRVGDIKKGQLVNKDGIMYTVVHFSNCLMKMPRRSISCRGVEDPRHQYFEFYLPYDAYIDRVDGVILQHSNIGTLTKKAH